MKKFKKIIAWLCVFACILSFSSTLSLATGSENVLTPVLGSTLYVKTTDTGKYLYGVPSASTAKSVVGLLEGDCTVSGDGYVCTGDKVTLHVNGFAVDTATVIILGDVYVDGVVNTKDLIRLKKYIQGTGAEVNVLAADIDGNGKINENDLTSLSSKLTAHVTDVYIDGQPNKTTYFAGEKFSSEGMFITVTYSNGEEYSYADGFTYAYPAGTCFNAGDKYIDVIYGGVSARVNVTVSSGSSSQTVNTENIIYYTTPALPANAGQTIDLSLYDVQLSLDKTTAKSSIKWSSGTLTVKNNKVTPSSKGVYTVKATSGSVSKTIYIVVKNESETEYVLYSNDFTSSDISDLEVVQATNGTVSVSNGKLLLSAPSSSTSFVRVLLPEFIGDFGDYIITTNATITAQKDARRWMAIMHRVQNNDYPYYQYSIRQNAAHANGDGVEFSYMTNSNNSWAYHGKTSFSEAISASSYYEFKIDVCGGSASGYINGIQTLTSSELTDYSMGRVGLQVCGTTTSYEDIKVTLAFRQGQSFGTATYSCPAIPCNTGATVRLAKYDVQFTQGVNVSAKDITWSSSDITVNSNKTVTVKTAGVYKLTAKYAGKSKTIYLIAKEPTSTEYVLYYNDFSSSDISDWDVVQTTNATVSVSNGKLVLAAPSSGSAFARVLLPEFIGDFGDYKITSNAAFTQKADERRWMAIMHRVQNNDYPYYQFCIRQNAAHTNGDGVEFSYMTNTTNSWAYHGKTSYAEALTLSKNYKFELDVYGTRAVSYINGVQLLTTSELTDYKTGRVGLQNCGSTTAYDDIKITIEFNRSSTYVSGRVDVQHTDSNIALESAVVTEVKSAYDFEKVAQSAPTVAIITIDNALNVLDSNGAYICTAKAAIEKMGGVTIPAFRVDTLEAANALGNFLKANNILESFVVSRHRSQISAVQAICTDARGIYDATTLGITDLATLRERANEGCSRICLLPASLATQKNTAFLSALATTVWYKATDNSKAGLYNLITSGAHGIVTDDPMLLKDCLTDSDVFLKNSIIRPVNIIGHRGIPSKAPENTIVGSKLAASYGANIIENDVYITTDGVVVVMHDGSIDRTTNGSGGIESMTYAQLQRYVVDYYSGYSEKIPTLEEYFQAFKGTGVNLFIEIKSQNKAIVPAIKTLIDKYDIMDQCCIITFHAAIIDEVHAKIPYISNGLLAEMLPFESMLGYTSRYNCTFNPGYASTLNASYAADCIYRGITVWPWTLNDSATFDQYFLLGVGGITTNYANFAQKYIKFISVDKKAYSVETGRAVPIVLKATTYAGKVSVNTSAEMIVIDGNDRIGFDGSSVYAYAEGQSTVIFRLGYKLNNGTTVYVYTQPVTIKAN